MGYKLPSDDEIAEGMDEVLAVAGTIGSQKRFSELVRERLWLRNRDYRITGKRLRKLAARSDSINLVIRARPGNPKKIMRACPVCGERLKNLKNQTIWGGEVTIEMRCPVCPYWTGKRKRIPTRYIFSLKD